MAGKIPRKPKHIRIKKKKKHKKTRYRGGSARRGVTDAKETRRKR